MFRSLIRVLDPWYKRPALKLAQRRFGDEYLLEFEDGSVYVGSSTVWYHFHNGRRCDTPTEGWLADVYATARREQQSA